MSARHAVAQIVHHVNVAGPNWTRNGKESWNSGPLLFFQHGVERVVAERKGNAVVWVVHHAIHALGTLLNVHVPRRNGLIEPTLLIARKGVVATCVKINKESCE